ncbi:hypothetical protein AMS68_002426 [Peltaster fructicola]|uniref:Carrier domain-containing protein n=1 Tax=Peltaster fructicola TaxID=286661 RepID=A0A6H0XQL4_9PEZI|nr:hypothetical protein AMS68_002426 [Peltaster fructicola]
MTAIWETVLGNTGIELGPESNFFAAGGNSLLLLVLQTEIMKKFGSKPSLAVLFNARNLAAMAASMEEKKSAGELIHTLPTVDWSAETSVDQPLANMRHKPRSRPFGQGLIVVLTGATGFLGRHTVADLVARSDIQAIHCLAVRNITSTIAQSLQALSNRKVFLHPGDLTAPRLGLMEEEERLLFADADVIIHNGADVSFMKPYFALRQPNVGSTKYLAEMAVKYGLQSFHYVSTTGVALLSDKSPVLEGSLHANAPHKDIDGYVTGKWVSECYLENLNKSSGLPITIYRPSTITGPGAPTLDITHNVVKFSRKMKAIPHLDGWRGYFDAILVHNCARYLIDALLSKGSAPRTDYIHLSGEIVVEIATIKDFLEKQTRYEFAVLNMASWVKGARGQGLHELVGTYLLGLASSRVKPRMPRLMTSLPWGKTAAQGEEGVRDVS